MCLPPRVKSSFVTMLVVFPIHWDEQQKWIFSYRIIAWFLLGFLYDYQKEWLIPNYFKTKIIFGTNSSNIVYMQQPSAVGQIILFRSIICKQIILQESLKVTILKIRWLKDTFIYYCQRNWLVTYAWNIFQTKITVIMLYAIELWYPKSPFVSMWKKQSLCCVKKSAGPEWK